MNSINIVAR